MNLGQLNHRVSSALLVWCGPTGWRWSVAGPGGQIDGKAVSKVEGWRKAHAALHLVDDADDD